MKSVFGKQYAVVHTSLYFVLVRCSFTELLKIMVLVYQTHAFDSVCSLLVFDLSGQVVGFFEYRETVYVVHTYTFYQMKLKHRNVVLEELCLVKKKKAHLFQVCVEFLADT